MRTLMFIIIITIMLSISAVGMVMILIPPVNYYCDYDQIRFWTNVEYFPHSSTYVFGATDVHTTAIGSGTYAIVTSSLDSSIQIIDITDPEMPVLVSKVVDDSICRFDDIELAFNQVIRMLSGTTFVLHGIEGVHTVTIGSNTYAVITNNLGIQIIDITDPEMPVPVSKIVDDSTYRRGTTDVHTVTIGSNTYAVITNNLGIQIIDITDPEMPVPVSKIDDDSTPVDGNTRNVHTTAIGSNTYAIVTGGYGYGIRIIDITDPEMPVPVSKIDDDSTLLLDGAKGVHTVTIGSNTYTVVTSFSDNGIQIIDITDPEMPVPVSSVVDDLIFGHDNIRNKPIVTIGSGTWSMVPGHVWIIDTTNPDVLIPTVITGVESTLLLDGAKGVHTVTIGSNTYAIVTSSEGNGIQIIDITDPEMPVPVSKVGDTLRSLFSGARNIDIATIGSNTYAIVTSNEDRGIQIIDITDPEMPMLVSKVISNVSRMLIL